MAGAGRVQAPIEAQKQAAPSGSPSTGFVYFYPKSDGRFYTKDDAGVERVLTPITVASSAPSSPAVGDLWVDTT